MTPDEREMLVTMATELINDGGAVTLVNELVSSGMADQVWSDVEAMAAIFQVQGAALASSTLLDHAATRASEMLVGRLVLPACGIVAPGTTTHSGVHVDGILLSSDDHPTLLVGLDSGGVLEVDRGALSVEPVSGLDPEMGVARVTGRLEAPTEGHGGLVWSEVAARAAMAVSFEMLGVAQAALDRAVQHVLERQQFGRPLAAFQVVRHRLANAVVVRTGATELALAAGWGWSRDEAVLVVKAAAGRAAILCVQEAQQVCGGIGFTAEFGLHRLVRRAYLLDSIFGGYEWAEYQLGRRVLETGSVLGLGAGV